MMYIAWKENSQGEIYDDMGINWGNWLPIGIIPMILGFACIGVLGIVSRRPPR